MELTLAQRRTRVALACRVAWADGKVTDEERTHALSTEAFRHHPDDVPLARIALRKKE